MIQLFQCAQKKVDYIYIILSITSKLIHMKEQKKIFGEPPNFLRCSKNVFVSHSLTFCYFKFCHGIQNICLRFGRLYPIFCLYVCLINCWFICLSICLFVYLFMSLFPYLWIAAVMDSLSLLNQRWDRQG